MKITPLERIIGTVAGTAPLVASVTLDKHFGFAIGCGCWGLLVLAWVWNETLGKGKTES